jgi:hypothetical protein
MSFVRASAVERSGSAWLARIPDGWQQGRGAFGGLVLGALARAMERELGDATRSLRALTADLCGPTLPGEARIEVSTLRAGKNLSNLDARLTQGGAVAARASGVFSTSRRAEAIPWRAPLYVPAEPSSVLEPLPVGPPVAPAFATHYEYRTRLPFVARPGAGAAASAIEPVAEGFIRLREAPEVLGAPELIGLLDAWWPAIFTVLGAPHPAATVSFAAEILRDPSTVRADEPLAYRARVHAEREGYFVEFRELHDARGPIAMNQQVFALLG